jgi:hypothetical protein
MESDTNLLFKGSPMTRTLYVGIGFLALLLTGCGSMPRTPDILVQNAKDGSMFSDKEIFVVNRPIEQIADIFKRKSTDCLNVQVTRTWRENGLLSKEERVYKPSLQITKQRTRLMLQTKVLNNTDLGGPPPDGWYMMVADAYPVDKNTTRVESYVQWTGENIVFKAVKHWANGTNMGCPDMTK